MCTTMALRLACTQIGLPGNLPLAMNQVLSSVLISFMTTLLLTNLLHCVDESGDPW